MNFLQSQGELADRLLEARGLKLTQGGEPTFVPHQPLAPEWNFAALGPEKLELSFQLLRDLVGRLIPGAILLKSSGKLYPGEPLPRWCLGLYRPKGGQAWWHEPSRLYWGGKPTRKARMDWAESFLPALAKRLKIKTDTCMPAFEDVEALMRMEESVGKSTPRPRFVRSKMSFRSAKWSAKDIAKWKKYCEPQGWVLPLDRKGERWITGYWKLPNDEELTLLWGTGSMGLRLPLSRLPQKAVRKAMTFEIVDGVVSIFFPPLPDLKSFGELSRAVEETVMELKLPPVLIEGYPPTGGTELEVLSIMADPGVVEVNLPPAPDWKTFESVARQLYASAEKVGLRGFKYQYSGRKTPSGGGAHIVLGGPSLAENPFLKQPTLLPSFLRFIQNHPSLSYLFTGLFTGPSSQAPRVDESCFELPEELEIALKAVESMEAPADAELMDGILRNLMLDWNGNTHRAEVSVDKFHFPFSPNGRLGLVEFRAYEMMPDAEMFLAVNLLIRALASAFATRPYREPLIDWKGELHTAFTLPRRLEQDLASVLDYLAEFGFKLSPEFFRPHMDFRFPVVHQAQFSGAEMEVRQAIEFWPVLGEQPNAAGGTSRTVDASTDRFQILIKSKPGKTWVITANGRGLKLVADAEGVAWGGVRYRLLELPLMLQPQVKGQTPLQIEIVDGESLTVVESFIYHGWKPKPGGYEGLPRSEAEAAERVRERVQVQQKRIGTVLESTPAEMLVKDLILDLRK